MYLSYFLHVLVPSYEINTPVLTKVKFDIELDLDKSLHWKRKLRTSCEFLCQRRQKARSWRRGMLCRRSQKKHTTYIIEKRSKCSFQTPITIITKGWNVELMGRSSKVSCFPPIGDTTSRACDHRLMIIFNRNLIIEINILVNIPCKNRFDKLVKVKLNACNTRKCVMKIEAYASKFH